MKTVGAYEAKTHLARLLDDVSNGEVVTITRHGVPVAKLVPAEEPQSMTRREVIEALKAFGRGRTLEGVTIKEMYWTLGHYDLVVVLEGDDEAVTSTLLKVGSLGNVRSETLRAFSAAEVGRIVGNIP